MAIVRNRIARQTTPAGAAWLTELADGQEVTVWLRSGWKVTGTVNHDQGRPDVKQGKNGADVRTMTVLRLNGTVTVLRLNVAKLAREGYKSEQEARLMLVPVENIELIGVKVQEPAASKAQTT
jgi:hypothetical protein